MIKALIRLIKRGLWCKKRGYNAQHKHLSQSDKMRILWAIKKGRTISAASRIVGSSYTTVYNYVRQYKQRKRNGN